ncbi:myosin light chain kinase family member 4-like [Mya arenaria]|uniref:myosin light chain kinase family member 4-like n=1 Tax=Mya arenaria TaxID=6604 RepID=UPI0022E391B2|nr:myosin light chain kinase family member 4-like [Mya arenaria]
MNSSIAQWSLSKTVSRIGSIVKKKEVSANGSVPSVKSSASVSTTSASVAATIPPSGVNGNHSDTSYKEHSSGNRIEHTKDSTDISDAKPAHMNSNTNVPDKANKDCERPQVRRDSHKDSAKAANGDTGYVDDSDSDSDLEHAEKDKHESSRGAKSKSHLKGLNVCFYKLKCMALDQNKMNHSKVHVDESEPTGYEEAPFDPRDVKIRNGCWITDEYDVSDILLGRGKFGEVKQCKEKKTGRDLAAKFIEVNGPTDRFDVQNEIEMMKCLQHPRLLQLYDVFTKRNHFCLVLELISGGELFERVINDDFILTEKACVMFMRQICEGIEFMHNNRILHLDLKPENILCLTRSGNRIKIIDFGLARRYNPKEDLRILFGTPEFMAPEQANFEPIFPSTDMWSIGIICYILLSGLSPFLGESEEETIANITEAKWDFKAEEFESVSAEAKDFISRLVLKTPSDRMTTTECLEHKWLRRSAKRERIPARSLSTKRLKKFVYRRKWQKAVNAMLALKRMGVKLQ